MRTKDRICILNESLPKKEKKEGEKTKKSNRMVKIIKKVIRSTVSS